MIGNKYALCFPGYRQRQLKKEQSFDTNFAAIAYELIDNNLLQIVEMVGEKTIIVHWFMYNHTFCLVLFFIYLYSFAYGNVYGTP